MLFDSHTHSRFSFDGDPAATVDAMCEAAIQKGLSGIAITDHCDVNGEVEGIYPPLDRDSAFLVVSAAKEKYREKLKVSVGIELGQASEYPIFARRVLSEHPYDFVLGSIHNLPHVPDFYYLRYDDMPEALYDQLFSRTLDEAMELCDFDGISSLAHLTYMHRYVLLAGRTMDFKKHEEKLSAVFRKMIDRGIALEINVSLLSKGMNVLMPTRELIALYRSCGGELFTVGSDAHSPDRVGEHIKDAYTLLKTMGVSAVAFFENKTPEIYKI